MKALWRLVCRRIGQVIVAFGLLFTWAACAPSGKQGNRVGLRPTSAAGNTGNSGSGATPSGQGQPGPLQGTADGSGGGIRKSTDEQIDKVLFNPDFENLSIKRRLRLMFHRLEFLRATPKDTDGDLVHAYLTKSGGMEEDRKEIPVFKVLDQIFAKKALTLHQDIEALVLKPQNPPCLSDDGRKTMMAIKDHTICVSREMVSLIAPENLLLQVLAAGAHEVAHLRGFKGEDEPEMLREYVIENQDFLIRGDSLSDLVELQQKLATVMIETAARYPDDRILQKEERCMKLVQSSERLGSLPGALIGVEIRHIIQNTIADRCIGINRQVLPRQSLGGGATQSREDVLAISDAVLEMVNKIEKRRHQFMKILSPFYNWHMRSTSEDIVDDILLTNTLRPLLSEEGAWQPKLNEDGGLQLRKKLTCTVDGESVSFKAANCPPKAESEAHVVRDYNLVGKTCALIKHKDSKGFEHQITIVSGPHSINSDGEMHSYIRDFMLEDIVNLQFLLNVNMGSKDMGKLKWPKNFNDGKFILAISGKNLMTPGNNVAEVINSYNMFSPFYESPMSGSWISALLHPRSTPEVNFNLHLPTDYDEFWDHIIFERKGIKIRCQLSLAAE